MPRNTGTDCRGASFTHPTIVSVWDKATIVDGYDKDTTRKDRCGALIDYDKYGETINRGWEVDHIIPVAKGGYDGLANLQPLQWENNRHKGDNFPDWSCLIKS